MISLTALWLPILLSAVIVFVASSVIHMMTPLHKGDFQKVPGEDKVMDALRPFNLPPGDYCLPKPDSMEAMKSPEFQAKVAKGPNVWMTVMPPGMGKMGQQLFAWFVYCVVVGVFGAYVASRTLPAGTPYLQVFRVVGTVTFAAYNLALWQMTIWYKRNLGTTIRLMIDGVVYALLTAGVFGWRWPHA